MESLQTQNILMNKEYSGLIHPESCHIQVLSHEILEGGKMFTIMELFDNDTVIVNRAPGSRFNLLCVGP